MINVRYLALVSPIGFLWGPDFLEDTRRGVPKGGTSVSVRRCECEDESEAEEGRKERKEACARACKEPAAGV